MGHVILTKGCFYIRIGPDIGLVYLYAKFDYSSFSHFRDIIGGSKI